MIISMTRAGHKKKTMHHVKLVFETVVSYLERVRDADQTPLSPPYLPHPPEERLHLFSHSGRSTLASPDYKTNDLAFDRTS